MIEKILFYAQPFTCITFFVVGICHMVLKHYKEGLIALSFAGSNWLIFYGDWFFKSLFK